MEKKKKKSQHFSGCQQSRKNKKERQKWRRKRWTEHVRRIVKTDRSPGSSARIDCDVAASGLTM